MKRHLTLATILISVALVVSCGGGGSLSGGSKLEIKIGGKDAALAVKSSGINNSVKTFTDTAGKMTTASSFYAIVANFDMDVTNVGTMRKPLTAPDQVRVLIQLIGEEGTNDKSELKPGVYKADPKEKFMKVDSVIVSTFADGKEVSTNFDTQFSGSKIMGTVNVTSATADAVSGTVDITDGDKSIKGSFTAKAAPKK